ncbi:MAG: RNA polymerase sigma factor [Nocardiopsaceae bacterium]|nr:RNA polymerase sigma factor [Nocardiopsaceae bacterium]
MDPQAVTAAQHGDALALDQLLSELTPYVRRLCTQIAPEVADDATQEALLAVFRGLPSLQAPEAIITWVRAITIRKAVRLARRADPQAAAAQPPAEPRTPSLEGLVDIGDALGRLPLNQRVVLVLRACEGLSEQQIAAALGISAGTVKSRLHRARAAFRKVWDS